MKTLKQIIGGLFGQNRRPYELTIIDTALECRFDYDYILGVEYRFEKFRRGKAREYREYHYYGLSNAHHLAEKLDISPSQHVSRIDEEFRFNSFPTVERKESAVLYPKVRISPKQTRQISHGVVWTFEDGTEHSFGSDCGGKSIQLTTDTGRIKTLFLDNIHSWPLGYFNGMYIVANMQRGKIEIYETEKETGVNRIPFPCYAHSVTVELFKHS